MHVMIENKWNSEGCYEISSLLFANMSQQLAGDKNLTLLSNQTTTMAPAVLLTNDSNAISSSEEFFLLVLQFSFFFFCSAFFSIPQLILFNSFFGLQQQNV